MVGMDLRTLLPSIRRLEAAGAVSGYVGMVGMDLRTYINLALGCVAAAGMCVCVCM